MAPSCKLEPSVATKDINASNAELQHSARPGKNFLVGKRVGKVLETCWECAWKMFRNSSESVLKNC